HFVPSLKGWSRRTEPRPPCPVAVGSGDARSAETSFPRRRAWTPAGVVSMGKSVELLTVRVLLFQMLAHALIFAAQNAGSLGERALLAPDAAATATLGLSGTAFCLLSGFTTNVVNGCQSIVGQRTGEGDEHGARAAVRQALVLAGGGGVLGLAIAAAAGAAAVF